MSRQHRKDQSRVDSGVYTFSQQPSARVCQVNDSWTAVYLLTWCTHKKNEQARHNVFGADRRERKPITRTLISPLTGGCIESDPPTPTKQAAALSVTSQGCWSPACKAPKESCAHQSGGGGADTTGEDRGRDEHALYAQGHVDLHVQLILIKSPDSFKCRSSK